jgi:hypothetical protein
LIVLVVYVKEWQQAAHVEGLRDDLGEAGEFAVAPSTFTGLENLDEKADAAGVETIDTAQVENDPSLTVADEILESLAQRLYRGPENQAALHGDDADLTKFQIAGFEWPQWGSLCGCLSKLCSEGNGITPAGCMTRKA